MLIITALYAGLLALLFVALSVVVIRRRGTSKIGLGSGGDVALERAIRGHGNFAEYTPLTLLLIAILELNGLAAWLVHLAGSLLLLGRLLHGYCFAFTESLPWARVGGMALTFAALVIAASNCLWVALLR